VAERIESWVSGQRGETSLGVKDSRESEMSTWFTFDAEGGRTLLHSIDSILDLDKFAWEKMGEAQEIGVHPD